MNKIIETRNNQWLEALSSEVEGENLEEQLENLFDDGIVATSIKKMFQYMQSKYDTHVTIACGDLPHIEPTLKETLEICKEFAKIVPDDPMRNGDYKSFKKALIKRSKIEAKKAKKEHKKAYHFSERGEQVVFGQPFVNQNVKIIEVTVKTEALKCDEFLYWSPEYLFIMRFVSSIDEEHSVSVALSL